LCSVCQLYDMEVSRSPFATVRIQRKIFHTYLVGPQTEDECRIHIRTPHFLFFNWFLMTPSIATKFQYVNSPFFIFLLTHYMFRPLRAILRWDIQLDVFKDYFYYVHNLTYRCYMHKWVLWPVVPQYMLSNLVWI
jgi:hypothetical protein